MPRRGVLICVAIQMEADALSRSLRFQQEHEFPVEIMPVGICAPKLPTQIDAAKAGLVISAGLAGALDPSLKLGDVIVDGTPEFAGARIGAICSAKCVIAMPSDKQALFIKSGALAVDMETDRIRAVAQQSGIPFLAVRAISDTSDQAVDPSLLGLIDPMGRARVGAIARTLLLRPHVLPKLMRLRADSQAALSNLGEFLHQHLPQWAKIVGL